MPGLLEEQTPESDEKSKKASSGGLGMPTGPGAGRGLHNGVVLDKDGKPCRTCTSSAAWMSMMKSSTNKLPSTSSAPSSTTSSTSHPASNPSTSSSSSSPPSETSSSSFPAYETSCPPDVDELGRSTWTLLHTLTATYPPNPTPAKRSQTHQFLSLFSQLYPCWVCAEDFQSWMKRPENDPSRTGELRSQEGFGRWMCRAHNEVNRKLGKEEFDCEFWRERWVDGGGRCD